MAYRIIKLPQVNLDLRKGEVAFPDIQYRLETPLNREKYTLKAAFTTITKVIGDNYFEDLVWKNQGDLAWQNETLEYLSHSISLMIQEYRNTRSHELLKRIFVRVQLWGGNAGRGIFIRNGGFEENFDLSTYEKSIELVLMGSFYEALKKMNQIKYLSTAFSTKHIHFWSKREAPIYDSIIAAAVLGRSVVKETDYPIYIEAIQALAKEKDSSVARVERNLFNWCNTPEGVYWRKLRLDKN